VDPRRCELHVLDDGMTWQFDLPEEGRGVVYRIDAWAGRAAPADGSAGPGASVTLRALDAAATYALTAYAGAVVQSPTDSSVEDFTKGPLFPMVHAVEPASGIAASAVGSALMEKGLELPNAGACWVVYRRMR